MYKLQKRKKKAIDGSGITVTGHKIKKPFILIY
jgi:hypothetical protein